MKLCMNCMESYEDSLSVCPFCGYAENGESEEANQLHPGTILNNRYVVGRTIGRGGFGITYIGYDAELKRKVAIKEYMPSEFSNHVPGKAEVVIYDGEKREQFINGLTKFTEEARRLAMFQDKEGIVQIYDCFQENHTAYLVMEHLDGITAAEKIKRDGKMGLVEALSIIIPILRSLKEVNAAGILHRDIAPDNVMLTKDGGAKLIDFGASRFATAGHSRSLTVLIKQGFAPVEQYNSRGEQGTWTDVYGLAATFYFLLTGKTPQDAMERKAHDQLKPPSKEGADVKKNVDVAIMNAMNVGIEYRTKTMEDFERELMSIEEVARVVEPEHREDLGKMPKWLKAALAAAAVLVVTFGVLLATGVINFGKNTSGAFKMAAGNTYVPTFVNQNYDKAGTIAKENRLQIQIVDSRFSDEIEKEMVLSQSLASGSEVQVNSFVDLVISAGREQTEIPYVLGMNVDEASARLKELGLVVETAEVDNNAVEGSVVSQSVEAMSLVDKGSTIRLEYSNGNLGDIDVAREVEMPDLVNKKYEDAQKALSDLGLAVSRSTQYSSEVAEGCVISQSESAGTVLQQGTEINLVVSLGVQMVNVPYVAFKPEADAKKLLKDAGLKVKVSYDDSEEVQKGNVISQSIAEGTKVVAGSEVTIVVSSGAKETTAAQATQESTTAQATQESTTAQATQESTTAQATQESQWSDWVTVMPSEVNTQDYVTESKTQYRSRDREKIIYHYTPPIDRIGGQVETVIGEWSEWSEWMDATQLGVARQMQSTLGDYSHKLEWQTEEQTCYVYVNDPDSLGFGFVTYSPIPPDSGTQDVKTQTCYRYRTRDINYIHYYYEYSDWSEWQDTGISSSDTREVEARTVYRYKKK